MRFLVASLRHELLPLAHRLKREGHEVEALVWRPLYEHAWEGSVAKIARHSDGTLHKSVLQPHLEAAHRGELTVLTNVRRMADLFAAAPRLYHQLEPHEAPRDVLLLGGWFSGEEIRASHLLVADWGTWAGGLGPPVLGGLTLVRLSESGAPLPTFLRGATQQLTERLKQAGFKGLFHFDVLEDAATGEMKLGGVSAGWPWLHTQAFVAELKSLSETLLQQNPTLLHKFVSVLPVSVPPWPNEKNTKLEVGLPIEGLTVQQQGRCFWYDITVDTESRKLRTAGLDGLLAVATGASDSTPALARSRALELAHRFQVPGRQFRPDLGAAVDGALARLEDRWGFVA